MTDYYGGSLDGATDRYLADCSRAMDEQDAQEADEETWPVCCKCGCKINPAEGMFTDNLFLGGSKMIEVPFHEDCYNTGFEGGTQWDEQDIRMMWRG